ncbi:MAG: D-alanyl-D-alanine carboxypeptidase family protein [Faecousia sp.]
MKKKRAFGVIVCLILLIQAGAFPSYAQSDVSVTSGCRSVDAAKPLDGSGQLLGTAKAVVVYELDTQTLIYGWNLDGQIYPSSMVKLMTALVAYEQGDLSRSVTVSGAALSSVGTGVVNAGLTAGETLTLNDLMYCMMVGSANDASAVIAEHIGGSQENFTRLMNAKAAELGCTGTNFSNAHGLHDANTYTTARDVLRIMQAVLNVPELKEMFCTVRYTVPATNLSGERTILSTNYMMNDETIQKYYDERVTGGKTGATDEAGRCLAVTAEGSGMNILAIVMGAEPTYAADGYTLERFGSFEEMAELLDYTFDTYQLQQVFRDGQAIAQFPVSGGVNSVVVEPGDSVNTVLPVALDEEAITWTYRDVTGNLTAPLKKGQKVSEIQVWYGDLCLAVADLVTMYAVSDQTAHTEADRIASGSDAGSWTGMLIVFAVFLCATVLILAGLMLVKAIRTWALRARRRRRRIHRRRSR